MQFSRGVDIAQMDKSNAMISNATVPKKPLGKQSGFKSDNNNNKPVDTQSRARRLKSHEPQPFLRVDNGNARSEDKQTIISQSQTVMEPNHNGTRFPRESFNPPDAPTNTPAPSRSASLKRAETGRISGSTINWNPMVPRKDKLSAAMMYEPNQVNHHVKSPFKHSVKKQPSNTKNVSPSLDMKQKTIIATQKLARMIATEPVEREERIQGRLLKARLKPLNVVKVEGPTIMHCKGIVSDSKNYDTIPSQTLQRRRQLVAGLLKNNSEYDRPQTGDSMHHTSIASDLSENRLDEVVPDIEYMEERDMGQQLPIDGDYFEQYTPNQHDQNGQDNHLHLHGDSDANSPSENFFVTEEDLVDEDHPYEEKENSRPESGESTRSILKDLPSRPTSRERRVGSAGDASRLQEDLDPEQDPKKAVRFADQDTIAIISARNRSKSAMPRLSSQYKEKKVKTGSCKPQDFNQMNDDDDYTDPDAEGGNPAKFNGSSLNTNRAGSSTSSKTSSNGARQTVSGKQNNNFVYDTRESLDNVVFSAQNVVSSSPLPRPSSASRPRSRAGAWEDLYKPDSDLTSLKIQGSNVEADPDAVEIKHILPYDFLAFNKISLEKPVSNEPGKKKKVFKGRPASAHEFNRKNRNKMEDERGKILSVKNKRTAGGAPRSATKRRPLSAVTITTTQSGLKASVNNSRFETDLKLFGNQMKQSVKPGLCCRCRLTSEDCYYIGEPGGKLVCGSCCEEVDKERRRKLKDHLLRSIQQDEGDELSGDPVDIDEYVTGLERELERRAQRTEKKLAQSDSTNKATQDNFMSTLELLEQSLNTVQDDIRSCMEAVDQPSEGTQLPVDEAVENDLGYASERDDETGKISEILTDKETFEIEQYRRRLKERKSSRSRPGSGVIRSRPSSGHSSGSLPKAGNSSRLGSANSSGIGSTEPADSSATETGSTQTEECSVKPLHQLSVTGDIQENRESKDCGLTVIATSKSLYTRNEEEDKSPIAPYPPLCFKLNARPPPGHLYYFAYGLNMNVDRLCYNIKRNITHRLWGLLFGFKLTFNKKGIDSEAGGFPNIEFNSTSSVEGVVYLIRQDELPLLDSSMGYPQHYEHVMLPVWMCNCDKPDDYGVAQYCIPALVYIAQDNYTSKGEKLSCEYSVDQCLKGSTDILTPQYTQFLQTLARP